MPQSLCRAFTHSREYSNGTLLSSLGGLPTLDRVGGGSATSAGATVVHLNIDSRENLTPPPRCMMDSMRFVLPMLFLCTLSAQPPQEAPRPGRGPMEMKNLKILKPADVMPAMRAFRTGLGVDCEFCHVKGDRASDANPHKVTAREMVEMTRQINTHFTDAKEHVTCYTCHRGEAEPKTAPPAAAAPAQ